MSDTKNIENLTEEQLDGVNGGGIVTDPISRGGNNGLLPDGDVGVVSAPDGIAKPTANSFNDSLCPGD